MIRAARVVPDVPSYSVDAGFWYSIPKHLLADVDVGSIVRVPLSGRRVRGWVIELDEREGARLKDIAAVSGGLGVFDSAQVESLTWAANHYVAPLSGIIARATPPNLPKRPGPKTMPQPTDSVHALHRVAKRSASGRKTPLTALVGNWRDLEWISALGPVLDGGQSVQIIAGTVSEVEVLATAAIEILGDVVARVVGEDDAGDTEAWERAQTPPCLMIGTPKTAVWHVEDLALVVVLEESRRVMKDRQTPTLHVRDVVITRSRLEGFNIVFFGPTPGVELLAAGADLVQLGNRAWPLVEVVDRSGDQPGSGFLSDRTLQAISAVAAEGRKVFIFTHRRIGASSMRCVKCRGLRTCVGCGARVGRVSSCPRCLTRVGPCEHCGSMEFEELATVPDRLVLELNRRSGSELSTVHPGTARVAVGTERDLTELGLVDLAVAADVDGMLMGSGYRTEEEALRQLARLAIAVRGGSGSRLMLQTSRPESMLVTTMRRGDPVPYLERVLIERAKTGSPPSNEMIAIEIRGEQPTTAEHDLGALDADILGPMPVAEGRRWLVTGSLGPARLELRRVVGKWRDGGATVRIDVDPIDL